MDNWKNVFEAHPDTEEIFVVDGMPFLEKGHAESHSNSTKKPIETVRRTDDKPDAAEAKAAKEAAAAEAKAAKEAAAAEAKAAKEAAAAEAKAAKAK